MAMEFQGTTISLAADEVTPKILLGEITGYSFEDGETSDIDITHSTSLKKEYMAGLGEADNISFDIQYEVGADGVTLAKACKDSGEAYFFEMVYSNGFTQTFQGEVKSLPHSGTVDDKLTGSVAIRLTAPIVETAGA